MEGWTSNFLSYGGRVTLVKAVLSAMPLHFMQALRIPIGIIRHINKMRRNFLWKENDICKGINCLINWERVCALKENGGLGIINLQTQNEALLTKWIWMISHKPKGLWPTTIRTLYGVNHTEQLGQNQDQSFFLKNLVGLLPFLRCTTKWNNGFKWRWTKSGLFTTSSAYRVLHQRGLICLYYKSLWKIKVPMKVRIFIWLLQDNKILTQEVLEMRGCHVQMGCHLCQNNLEETRDHMLWECRVANTFWQDLCAHFNFTVSQGAADIVEVWDLTRNTLDKNAGIC